MQSAKLSVPTGRLLELGTSLLVQLLRRALYEQNREYAKDRYITVSTSSAAANWGSSTSITKRTLSMMS